MDSIRELLAEVDGLNFSNPDSIVIKAENVPLSDDNPNEGSADPLAENFMGTIENVFIVENRCKVVGEGPVGATALMTFEERRSPQGSGVRMVGCPRPPPAQRRVHPTAPHDHPNDICPPANEIASTTKQTLQEESKNTDHRLITNIDAGAHNAAYHRIRDGDNSERTSLTGGGVRVRPPGGSSVHYSSDQPIGTLRNLSTESPSELSEAFYNYSSNDFHALSVSNIGPTVDTASRHSAPAEHCRQPDVIVLRSFATPP